MHFLFNTLLALTLLLLAPNGVSAALSAQQLAQLVAHRPSNEARAGTMHFRLQNRSGSLRVRRALMVSSTHDTIERIAIFFTAPAMIEETAFLSFNHVTRDDESWLYLPATDRVRRLPSSDRGDYFMGTDLTFGDVKDNFKFNLDDWIFKLSKENVNAGTSVQVLEGTASTPAIAKETGYGHFSARIDTATGFPIVTEYSDIDMAPLKRIEVLQIEQIGTTKMATHFTVENLQTGHSTEIHYTDTKALPDIDESLFDSKALAYGIPDVQ